MSAARRQGGARSVPALYGALTAGLVAVVMVIASVVSPANPPSISELSPSARDRIEEARHDQGIGPSQSTDGRCAPGEAGCVNADAAGPNAGSGPGAGVTPPLEVAAGRRCYGDPPRQTEDPHSPPCVFEIFKGDNGGAAAPGVTATEIRVVIPSQSFDGDPSRATVEALIAHFNTRYEFYGRRLRPIFLTDYVTADAAVNKAAAEQILAAKPFAAVSWYLFATSTGIHRRLAEKRVISIVSDPAMFDSDAVVDGFTWLVEPPLDARLSASARFACQALKGRPASHAGSEFQSTPRRFAVVVVRESSGVRPDHRPLVDGLDGCGARFEIFEISMNDSQEELEVLALQLKRGGFTTALVVNPWIWWGLFQAASSVGYFPEWIDIGSWDGHDERSWAGDARQATEGHGVHSFGLTSDMRIRPNAEYPSRWALQDGDASGTLRQALIDEFYQPLLVLASGIQGAGPNLTPETFAQALRSTRFPNPNAGAPPYWQQGIGFGLGDFVFHDDYAIWWWNDNAPSQTSDSVSGRGSFCYLDRGGRFSANSFPADADSRLFSASEPCR